MARTRKKDKYKVGTNNGVRRLIDKSLDRKIKRKMLELKKDDKEDSNKITYIYASKIIGRGKK